MPATFAPWPVVRPHLAGLPHRLKMRTFAELERIIWRTSKVFVYGNPYNIVLATKPAAASRTRSPVSSPEEVMGE
jgi:hypothetical protein